MDAFDVGEGSGIFGILVVVRKREVSEWAIFVVRCFLGVVVIDVVCRGFGNFIIFEWRRIS